MAISVLIVTRNREQFLEFVLRKLSPMFRADDELVVVDDESDCPLGAASLSLWAAGCRSVQLLRNEQSSGLIHARNRGMQAVRNDTVLQLDDDSWPVGEHVFQAIEAAMSSFPAAGALAFPIHQHWSGGSDEVGSRYPRCRLPDGTKDFAFIGCGVALRRGVFRATGGYPEYGIYGAEEEALGLRILAIGYDIRVCHAIRVIHGHEQMSWTKSYGNTKPQQASAEVQSNRICLYRDAFSPVFFIPMVLLDAVSLISRGKAREIPVVYRMCKARWSTLGRYPKVSVWVAARYLWRRFSVYAMLRVWPFRRSAE